MIKSLCNGFFAAVLVVAMCGSAAFAAEGKMVANPQYAHWAKFKVGSWSKLQNKMEGGEMQGEMTITFKLVELTAEQAVVETQMSMTVGSQQMDMPGQRQVIPAKVAEEQVKEIDLPGAQDVKTTASTGEEEIKAAGQTLKCRWTEMTAKSDQGDMKVKAWTTEQVPGGLVKAEMKGQSVSSTMTLVGFEAAK